MRKRTKSEEEATERQQTRFNAGKLTGRPAVTLPVWLFLGDGSFFSPTPVCSEVRGQGQSHDSPGALRVPGSSSPTCYFLLKETLMEG